MNKRAFVATRKGLFELSRAGDKKTGEWQITQASFLGDNVTLFMHDPRSGSLYAALDHGHFGVKLHRSLDEGKTWAECTTPKYPERPEGTPDEICEMSGKAIPWSLKLIWALAPGGADEPGVLWCGTVPGGLFRSVDHGATWELIRSLWDEPSRKNWFGGGLDYPGIHSICVHPENPSHITIGISCGGVWVTEDGGSSWKCRAKGMFATYMPPDRNDDGDIQDPHCVVQCLKSPATFWAQHHNGVFRSTDGCENWQEISAASPSTFGFAVAVHPKDPDTAWLVPAIKDEKRIPVDGQVVVSRTRDGGKTFEVLRNGLPQHHAYDITFRHALDIDETGSALMFGSTTGSLWYSDDQGDNWQTITSHLPPVHCVRFA